MKSLNGTEKLWTSQSAKDVDVSDYQAACCLNAKVSSPRAKGAHAAIKIENEEVPQEFLKKVLDRAEQAKGKEGHSEEIKHQ
jgi:hypothetical protein